MNSQGRGFWNSSFVPRSVTSRFPGGAEREESWGWGWEGAEDLHQKKMSTWVTAVRRARLRRQLTPIRGRADSKQTTLSTAVTNPEGSSPFNLKQDTGRVSKSSEEPQPKPHFKQKEEKEGGALRPLLAYKMDLVSWLHSFQKFPMLAT